MILYTHTHTHTNNLEKVKRKNIGANSIYSFDTYNIKTDNRISSIYVMLKQKWMLDYRKILQTRKIANNEQGITLLALVVTVVIMLILAAVGIGLVIRR